MAFSVAPTSGDAPYILSAEFNNASSIDGVNYYINVGYSQAVGSCPPSGITTFLTPQQLASLLANGSVSLGTPVIAGSCRSYTLTLLRLSDNTVIDSSTVSVDNV